MKKINLVTVLIFTVSINALAVPGLTSTDKHVIAGDQAMRRHNDGLAESNFLAAAKYGDTDAEMMLGKLYLEGSNIAGMTCSFKEKRIFN